MAEDMTIDAVAETYGVSRSTVERAINNGFLRAHDGYNEQHNPATMVEPDDALHWWNTRHLHRKRKTKRGQVRVLVGDVLDAAADAADDDTDDEEGAAEAEGDSRALVTPADAVRMTIAEYARGAWVAGHQQAEQTLRPVVSDLTTRLVDAERRAAAAEQRAQAAADEVAALREQAVRADASPDRRTGLLRRLFSRGTKAIRDQPEDRTLGE